VSKPNAKLDPRMKLVVTGMGSTSKWSLGLIQEKMPTYFGVVFFLGFTQDFPSPWDLI
jgi:hypothetical protein